jgi:hypothetical protein
MRMERFEDILRLAGSGKINAGNIQTNKCVSIQKRSKALLADPKGICFYYG